MRVILRAVGGPGQGVQFLVRRGQVARVGRTEWADFCVPADPAMSDVHFSVECGPKGCRLRAGFVPHLGQRQSGERDRPPLGRSGDRRRNDVHGASARRRRGAGGCRRAESCLRRASARRRGSPAASPADRRGVLPAPGIE